MHQHNDAQKLLERFHQSIERPPQASDGRASGAEYLNHMMEFAKESKAFKRVSAEQLNLDYVKEQFGDCTIL